MHDELRDIVSSDERSIERYNEGVSLRQHHAWVRDALSSLAQDTETALEQDIMLDTAVNDSSKEAVCDPTSIRFRLDHLLNALLASEGSELPAELVAERVCSTATAYFDDVELRSEFEFVVSDCPEREVEMKPIGWRREHDDYLAWIASTQCVTLWCALFRCEYGLRIRMRWLEQRE
ncbi:hypothetical protein LTS18_006754 [Coniosporium uncinatum]|uniref:Uncharacterized protein n=1 Tax=Coniosporium uncinatum TaxID=93489 RepID=A0ACC3D3N8_9PEZI|nr:hypothetical protein LTS18_006754 [Coniosporium uncinatum]